MQREERLHRHAPGSGKVCNNGDLERSAGIRLTSKQVVPHRSPTPSPPAPRATARLGRGKGD